MLQARTMNIHHHQTIATHTDIHLLPVHVIHFLELSSSLMEDSNLFTTIYQRKQNILVFRMFYLLQCFPLQVSCWGEFYIFFLH